jgi:hypothetical protein
LIGRAKRTGRFQIPGWATVSRHAGAVVIFGVMLGLMAFTVAQTEAQIRALREQWDISGPPCAVATTALDPVEHLGTEFSYVGADYAFDRAGVYCADVPDRTLFKPVTHQVCQFNNPRFVRVHTRAGVVVFDIPPLRVATVIVRNGRPSCVLAGWFR